MDIYKVVPIDADFIGQISHQTKEKLQPNSYQERDSKKQNKTNLKMKDRAIYLLIGPKGSGKSVIGNLMEQEFGIKFIRVEDWAKQLKRNRAIDNQQYIKEVFETIENGVKKSLESNDQIVFESTGLTNHFDQMVKNLKDEYTVITIGIKADQEICISRFESRDQTIHVNVSDKEINRINEKVRERNLSTNFSIINEGKTKGALIHELENILSQSENIKPSREEGH